tara:strand:+ start:652 stop:759 length:108 start_codon:yes stop_codon:yes gene_type:complete
MLRKQKESVLVDMQRVIANVFLDANVHEAKGDNYE